MTYFEDTGTLIAAPIDFVWEYLESQRHATAHRDVRSFRLLKTEGATSTVRFERFLQGKWSKGVNRTTEFPPFCICVEETEGTFAGSRFVLHYRPVGNQTQVNVYGDARSKRLPPARAKRLFLDTLESAYLADVPVLLAFRRERARARARRRR